MVTYVKGDLFNSPAQVLTNTVNCVGVMGKGVALEFKNRYPELFSDYKIRCEQGNVKPGEPYLWEDDRVQILNFPTKRHWKENSLLQDIEDGLKYLAANYDKLSIQSIAMPAIGCGNGGLDWKAVKLLIDKYLDPIPDLDVYVYGPDSALTKESSSEQEAPQVCSDKTKYRSKTSRTVMKKKIVKSSKPKKKPSYVDTWLERETPHKKAALENASRHFDERDDLNVNTLEAIYGQESSFGKIRRKRGISGAAGDFQMERETAKRMGLTVSKKNDERFDVDNASAASAKYLKVQDKNFSKKTILSESLSTIQVEDSAERKKFVIASFNAGELL